MRKALNPECVELATRISELTSLSRQLIELDKLDLGQPNEEYYGSEISGAQKRGTRYPSLYIYNSPKPLDLPETGRATIEYKIKRRGMNQNEEDGKTKTSHTADIDVHSIEPIVEKVDPEKAKLLHGVSPIVELARVIEFGLLDSFIPLAKKTGKGLLDYIRANPLTSAAAGGAIAGATIAQRRKKKPIVEDDETAYSADLQPRMIEFDSRARNPMGQFAETAGDTITPEQVHAAYRTPLAAGVGAGAAAGLAALLRKGKRKLGGLPTASV